MASPPDYPDPSADSAALRLAGALRFCREPALAFARILALATATRCLTGALALAGVEAHAMNGFHALFRGSWRRGRAAKRQRNRRGGESRARNDTDLHVNLPIGSLNWRTAMRTPHEPHETCFARSAPKVTENVSVGVARN